MKEELNIAAELKALREVVATKDDLKGFATKDDLKEAIKPLALAITKNTWDIQVIQETMATKTDIHRITERIDHISGKLDILHKDVRGYGHRLKTIEPKVENYEQRLRFLESEG